MESIHGEQSSHSLSLSVCPRACAWLSRVCLTWMMLVPFLKLVKDLMTSRLMASTDCFQVAEKPRTSWVIRAGAEEREEQSEASGDLHLRLPSPSSLLRRSSWPFSSRASASFTKAIIPPKGGDRISSMNSWRARSDRDELWRPVVLVWIEVDWSPVSWPAAAAGSPPPLCCRLLLSPGQTSSSQTARPGRSREVQGGPGSTSQQQ